MVQGIGVWAVHGVVHGLVCQMGGWIKACVYYLVGKNACTYYLDLVKLEFGVGSGLDGGVGGEAEEEEEDLKVVAGGSGLVQFMKWKI